MTGTAPAVSVVVCLHNAAAFIERTLASVLAQTFRDFELIVIDDGSTDGSGDIVERRVSDPRLRLVRQHNTGLGATRQRGLDLAAGEFIAFIDHDDLWHPEKLARQMAAAGKRSDAGLVFTDCWLVDADDGPIARASAQWPAAGIESDGTVQYQSLLKYGCFITLSSVLLRTRMARDCGGFNPRYRYVEDYDLWLRIARRHPLVVLNEPLTSWRVHDGQFTRRFPDVALREHCALIEDLLRNRTIPADVRVTLGDFLLGQHRVTCASLFREWRLRGAARAAVGMFRYPDAIFRFLAGAAPIERVRERASQWRGAVRHWLGTTAARQWQLARLRASRAPRRAQRWIRREPQPVQAAEETRVPRTSVRAVWVDGSALSGIPTGYFGFTVELVRALAALDPTRCRIHVVTPASGARALRERLGQAADQVRIHRPSCETLHWSDVHRLITSWQTSALGGLLWMLVLVAGLSRSWPAATLVAALAAALHSAFLVNEVRGQLRETMGRPVRRASVWVARRGYAWCRRARRPGGRDVVEVIVWRGRFRFRQSVRVGVIQDLTTHIVPAFHTPGNIVEFNEYLEYVRGHADAVATVSEHSRRDIVAGLDVFPDAVTVIPDRIDPQYWQTNHCPERLRRYGLERPYILTVGSLEPRKNLRRLVRVFETLVDDPVARECELVFVGPPGWDEGFARFVEESSARARIRVTGFVAREDLPSMYHHARAVICASVYEGFGLPVLEAMASSAAVLASNVSALPEVIGPAGLTFDPRSDAAIREALVTVLSMDAQAARAYRASCRTAADAWRDRWTRMPVLPGLPPLDGDCT